MSSRFISTLAATLGMLTLLVAAPFAGAAPRHQTRLFVSETYPAFHGSIESDDANCLGGRLVVVTRRLNGRTRHLGSAFTNAAGKWRVKVGLTSGGEYWVTVPSSGADCGGVRSRPIPVD